MAANLRSCAWGAVVGVTHSKKLSREHALGEQFGPLVAGPAPYAVDRLHFDLNGHQAEHRNWSSDKPTAWVSRAFCRSCNNHWMARIDDAARPALEPLISGKRQTPLAPTEANYLARWAYKSAIVFEFVAGSASTHAPHVRQDFCRDQALPDHAAVVLGTTSVEYANAAYAIRHVEILPDHPASRVSVFTLLLKGLVLQVSSCLEGGSIVQPLDLLPLRTGARAVMHPSPSEPVSWPPSHQIHDAQTLRSVMAGTAPYPPETPFE